MDYMDGVYLAAIFGLALDLRAVKRAVKRAEENLREQVEREGQEVRREVWRAKGVEL